LSCREFRTTMLANERHGRPKIPCVSCESLTDTAITRSFNLCRSAPFRSPHVRALPVPARQPTSSHDPAQSVDHPLLSAARTAFRGARMLPQPDLEKPNPDIRVKDRLHFFRRTPGSENSTSMSAKLGAARRNARSISSANKQLIERSSDSLGFRRSATSFLRSPHQVGVAQPRFLDGSRLYFGCVLSSSRS